MDAWQIFLHNLIVNTHEKRYYCQHCGAVILAPQSTHGGKPRRYCTTACADEAYLARKREEKMRVVRERSALAKYEPAKVL